MRAPQLAVALIPIFLSGCAVVQSPKAWNQSIADINPESLDVLWGNPQNSIKFQAAYQSVTKFEEVINLTSVTASALDSKSSEVKKTLDYASGGNYLWGIAGAGAALAKAPAGALTGIGFLGGTHVALSSRLSPVQQLDIFRDTTTRLRCISTVSQKQIAVFDQANKALDSQKQAINSAAPKLQHTTFMLNVDNVAAIETKKASFLPADANDTAASTGYSSALNQIKNALWDVLTMANGKLTALYTNEFSSSFTTDLVQKTQAATLALQQSAQSTQTKNKAVEDAAQQAKNEADPKRKQPKLDESQRDAVTEVTNAQKKANNAQQNVDDALTTLPVELKACTG